MDHSAAFFQTFYQYDDLFSIAEKEVVPMKAEPESTPELPAAPEEREVVKEAPPAPPATATPIAEKVAPVNLFPPLQHRILVLVDEPAQAALSAPEALLLENILKATGHSSAQTDLINFSYIPQADARTVLAQKSTNYFITFGVPLIKLQLDLLLPPYTPKQIEGIWFLLADPLPVINTDKALKKRLWQALQSMFALS